MATNFTVQKQGENGIDVFSEEKPVPFRDEAKYSYTWPGQEAAIVTGKELNALCKGADPSMLSISEVVAEPIPEVVRRAVDDAKANAMHQVITGESKK